MPTCGRPFDLPPRSPLQLKPRTLLRDQYLIGRALGEWRLRDHLFIVGPWTRIASRDQRVHAQRSGRP